MKEKMVFITIETEEIKHCTDDAILVAYEGQPDNQMWLPRSTLSLKDDQRVENMIGEPAILQVHDWILKKKGVI